MLSGITNIGFTMQVAGPLIQKAYISGKMVGQAENSWE